MRGQAEPAAGSVGEESTAGESSAQEPLQYLQQAEPRRSGPEPPGQGRHKPWKIVLTTEQVRRALLPPPSLWL